MVLNGSALDFVTKKVMKAVAALIITVSVLAGTSKTFAGRQAQVSSESERPLAFDVASIKPNRSSDPPSSLFPLGPGDAYVGNGGLFSATNQASHRILEIRSQAGTGGYPWCTKLGLCRTIRY